ncbi:ATP-binding protein [Cognatiluteimonas profundi]|uniref:ATP-binding protein n=1 Tax=Cognatiluteimonas profundi TaxID=2594501 RepID=UPI00131A7254|nr:ATP-binding protein [Lysobacter profundi]
MSLRLRLVLTIGIALALLWGVAAAWMLRDLDRNLQRTLDERLAMSARMVSGLLEQARVGEANASPFAIRDVVTVPGRRGIACQVRSLRGEVMATTQGASRALMAAHAPGYATRTLDGAQWRTYTLQANGLSITTADSLNERAGLGRRIALAAGIPFLIAAVGGLLALWFGAGRGLAPLGRLRQTLAVRAPDSIDPLDAGTLPLELRPLVDALNHHLQRVAQAVLHERHFTSHAAHELRTPLTAIDTHLQVACLTTGEDAERALDDAREGVRRMRATLDQLLMLARVEGQARFDAGEPVAAREILERVVAASGEDARGRLDCSDRSGDALLSVPGPLAFAAVRNLVDNALRYSPPGSRVDLAIDADDTSVRFAVLDQGAGLHPGEQADAVRRFWRGRSATPGGSGLGLAIVAAIAERYEGRFTLRANAPVGTVAELVLPRAPLA